MLHYLWEHMKKSNHNDASQIYVIIPEKGIRKISKKKVKTR